MARAEATSRYVRQSPRKLRDVATMVRGLQVERALDVLHFSVKRASVPIEKTVRSAVANYKVAEAGTARLEDLFVESITIDEGPTLRRFRPRAMGRATQVLKRSSHLSVVLATKDRVQEAEKP